MSHLKHPHLLLLQNLPFYPPQQNNHPQLSKPFPHLPHLYLNDPFAPPHPPHPSTPPIPPYLPPLSRFLIQKQLQLLPK
ncbi:phosphoglycerate kinase, partial [Bacillus pumilus]|uniref:phosphoglycerate kinase n=1 Tax=Bacillus pumilus TaxID=1408 RepID=UPI0011A1212C